MIAPSPSKCSVRTMLEGASRCSLASLPLRSLNRLPAQILTVQFQEIEGAMNGGGMRRDALAVLIRR
jgi:hypothetical protein